MLPLNVMILPFSSDNLLKQQEQLQSVNSFCSEAAKMCL